jgi:hypothetical protein
MKALLPLFAILAALLSTWALPARAEDTPMVWAFQHFCADETFTLDEARLAIAVAGGKQRGPTATASLPTPLSVTFWDIVIEGHRLGIALGGQRVPAGPGGVVDMASCAIYANGGDAAGIKALGRWAAVAPDTNPATGLSVYRFVSEKGKHIPFPHGQSDDAGRVWQLYLAGGPHANVTPTRFFKTREHS